MKITAITAVPLSFRLPEGKTVTRALKKLKDAAL